MKEFVKLGVGMVVGSGVGTIIAGVVNTVVPKDISKVKRFTVIVGGAALSSFVGTKVGEHVGEQIDEAAETAKGLKKLFTRKNKEVEEVK